LDAERHKLNTATASDIQQRLVELGLYDWGPPPGEITPRLFRREDAFGEGDEAIIDLQPDDAMRAASFTLRPLRFTV
jgi:hypothetical protein